MLQFTIVKLRSYMLYKHYFFKLSKSNFSKYIYQNFFLSVGFYFLTKK